MPHKTLEEVRQMVAAIRATVPGAAVIVYHDSPVTPRVRVFHDADRPRNHLSLPPDFGTVYPQFRKLMDDGRTVIVINDQGGPTLRLT